LPEKNDYAAVRLVIDRLRLWK